MRKADELSTTTAPAFTALGANSRDALAPAENKAMSTPSNDLSVNSSTAIVLPPNLTVLPTERELASAFSLPTGKLRFVRQPTNSAPTAPVAPTMATTGFFMLHSQHQQKKPRTFRRGSGSGDATNVRRAYPPKPDRASSSWSCAWSSVS